MATLDQRLDQRLALDAWIEGGLGREPARLAVEVEGAAIETLVWGREGAPGLLFVHGLNAHAEWWAHIAPRFADAYRVAAVSLSFAGVWRERYSYEVFAEELWASAQAAGLYLSGKAPVFVGHSFGGNQVIYTARRYPDRLSAGILVDCGIILPPPDYAPPSGYAEQERLLTRDRPYPVYASVEEALEHFRLVPDQPPSNQRILDFIARKALRRVTAPNDHERAGWTWRFDPEISAKWDLARSAPVAAAPPPPLKHVWGELSSRTAPFADAPSLLDLTRIGIPLGHHHLMIDQPVALVSTLRALLAP